MDITHDPKGGFDSYKFANYLLQIKDPRIKYIISNGRISSGSGQAHPAWQWRSYNGSNKHDHHIHISVKSTKDSYDSTKPWDLEVFFNKAKPSPVQPVEPLIVTSSDSTEANRERMGQLILDFEARRDKKGHLAIYPLPRNDRGGFYEVAGINDGYHPEEAAELATLIHAGRYNDAEKRAREIIIEYTNPVAGWYQHPALEFFLRDTAFNRGPGAPRTLKRNARGASAIFQHAVGVDVDGIVGSVTLAAAKKLAPKDLLVKLRESREWYEREVIGYRANFWRGLVNRWDKAKAAAETFIA